MSKSIYKYDSKGQVHGYAEEYDDIGLWCRCTYNHGREIGYEEVNLKDNHTLGQEGTEVIFHIR